ncbi:hypothetical protein PN36_07690 [Candidatus Thiomargarita nelsonii]|uniref:Uncharacterized protein n=1 Tax=Candidatus Thiomargarita nelsonii TaxID=1003181 RepID=A0A0A6P887_9GAMM|nr:hypothetical protein PN36_07690 [Candidatus Thiomargarita nelsonii]
MLSINLRTDIENSFRNVVQENYNGNWQNAIASFLKLQEKYGWKEQLLEDVTLIRAEVRRKGGISSATIDDVIKKYRNNQQGGSNG